MAVTLEQLYFRVMQLPAKEKACLIMRERDKLSYEKIGTYLQLSSQEVKKLHDIAICKVSGVRLNAGAKLAIFIRDTFK